MLNVSNNGIIVLHRSDTFKTTIFVNLGTKLDPIRYILGDNDSLYFAVMEPHQPFEHALIRKEMTWKDLDENDDVILTFKASDTECLLPGNYFYEVKLRRFLPVESGEEPEEEIDTIIPRTKFILLD